MMVDRRKGIQSFEIGFRVLQCLENAHDPLTLTQISRSSGMAPSKVHLYLVSLCRSGLVMQESYAGRYELGPAALRLGLSALARLSVIDKARAEIPLLRDRTGQTVFLSVWGDFGPTVVNRLDGRKVATLEVRVGSVVPLLTSATGNVFLAWLPRAVTAPFVKKELALWRRNGSAPDRKDIAALQERVRKEGVASTRGGVIRGIVAVAAPVFDHQGDVRCALTVMGSENDLDVGYSRPVSRAALDSAMSASRAAGFRADTGPTRSTSSNGLK
jgi:DNA-binding IclR family transcriptional regulator